MDKKTLEDLMVKYLKSFLVGIFVGLLMVTAILLIMLITEETSPELYFPNQDENGFFPICIDGFMAGCTPQGCVASDPVIECQIIQVNVGEK